MLCDKLIFLLLLCAVSSAPTSNGLGVNAPVPLAELRELEEQETSNYVIPKSTDSSTPVIDGVRVTWRETSSEVTVPVSEDELPEQDIANHVIPIATATSTLAIDGERVEVDSPVPEDELEEQVIPNNAISIANTLPTQNSDEVGVEAELEEQVIANYIIPVPTTLDPGVVKSFNYRLPTEKLWKEERRMNDWVYSSWRPDYTLEYRWLCPREVQGPGMIIRGSLQDLKACVTIVQLKYYNQVTDILLDTYEIERIKSYDLRDVNTNHYIVPEKLEEQYVEVSLVMLNNCVRLKYKINENNEVTTKWEKITCDKVGYAEEDPGKQHKWKRDIEYPVAGWGEEEQMKEEKQREKGRRKGRKHLTGGGV